MVPFGLVRHCGKGAHPLDAGFQACLENAVVNNSSNQDYDQISNPRSDVISGAFIFHLMFKVGKQRHALWKFSPRPTVGALYLHSAK